METNLICPKCQGALRSYERNGIQIEQCSECRGVFLDRGELERLIEAESAYAAGQAETSAGPAPGYQPGWEGGGHGGHGGGGHGGYGYGGGKHGGRRKRGLLGELFD